MCYAHTTVRKIQLQLNALGCVVRTHYINLSPVRQKKNIKKTSVWGITGIVPVTEV